MAVTQQRQPARRVFAAELNESYQQIITEEYDKKSDKAPKFGVLRTGAFANRVLIAGTLTETTVADGGNGIVGHITDLSKDKVIIYAGEYQPEVEQRLREIETPEYVSLIAKHSVDSDDENSDPSVFPRPEELTVTDKETVRQWALDTAERTLDRIETAETDPNEQTRVAQDKYGDINLETYREMTEDVVKELTE